MHKTLSSIDRQPGKYTLISVSVVEYIKKLEKYFRKTILASRMYIYLYILVFCSNYTGKRDDPTPSVNKIARLYTLFILLLNLLLLPSHLLSTLLKFILMLLLEPHSPQ